MMLAMAQKNKIQLQPSSLPPVSLDRRLSGSDIESILLTARRRALTQGQEHVRREDILAAWDQFLPSAQGLEKELQELSAVLECTELEFLPEDWRELVSKADGRLRLQRRFRKVLRRLGQ